MNPPRMETMEITMMYDTKATLAELARQKEAWGSVADFMVADVLGQMDGTTFEDADIEMISHTLGEQYAQTISQALIEAATTKEDVQDE